MVMEGKRINAQSESYEKQLDKLYSQGWTLVGVFNGVAHLEREEGSNKRFFG